MMTFLHCSLKTACHHQLIFMAQALIKSSTVAPMPLNTLQQSNADSLRVNLPKISLCNAAYSTEKNPEHQEADNQETEVFECCQLQDLSLSFLSSVVIV